MTIPGKWLGHIWKYIDRRLYRFKSFRDIICYYLWNIYLVIGRPSHVRNYPLGVSCIDEHDIF